MPVFNSYIATRKTSRRQKDSSSAGAAKVPRVGVNKSDLEAQGIQNGWTAGPVTHNQVREMSSSELRWHEIYNATNLENALALPGIAAERKDIDRQWGAKKFWDKYWGTENQASPEESKRILAELQKFQASFPQFIVSRAENAVLLEWLRDRNLDLTYRNLVDSFEANALEGKIWLNPNAISAGPETEVSGQQLLQHHNFFKLLQSQRRPTTEETMSADQWLAAHNELKDKREPPIVTARREKAKATAAHFQQSDNAQQSGEVVNVIDYEREPRGGSGATSISEIEKASFRNLLRNLNSQEFAERCTDPQFKAAVDRLGEK